MSNGRLHVDAVVPTLGRPSLTRLLLALADQEPAVLDRVIVVDDRPKPDRPLDGVAGVEDRLRVEVVPGRAAGPAAARNAGWRRSRARWVAFLDDDVVPRPEWSSRLAADLAQAELDPAVVGVQGRIAVPLPVHRRPRDWERNVAGLEQARWATADMAVRRDALEAVDGFDETFPRAYREDADLALRLMAAGGRLVSGTREIVHPVRPAPWHTSIRLQAGNADDATMRRRHGRGWRRAAEVPRGAFRSHAAVTAALVAGAGLFVAGRRRAATVAVAAWAMGTAAFAQRRIAPGPRTAIEVAAMAVTSLVIPPLAVTHRLAGEWRVRRLPPAPPPRPVRAVLFDRDGTLVVDVPYNGDPTRVAAVPGAAEALDELRRAGLRLGIVTNQSGVGRGLLSAAQVEAVNERVASVLGPFDTVEVCPHGPADGCRCRKPQPGLVHRAADVLGVDPEDCVVVGDIEADVDAAVAAGARAVLVPTAVTRPEEVEAARNHPSGRVAVAPDLAAACRRVLGNWPLGSRSVRQ